MRELENKIWDIVHKWCDGQYPEIPDQNRRYLMDEIKALILSNVSNCRCNEPVKCRNCDEMVVMVSEGEFCPSCYC